MVPRVGPVPPYPLHPIAPEEPVKKRILQYWRQSLVACLLGVVVVAAGVQACCGSDGYSAPESTAE